ncbi:MAG: HEAT repeat domain-containing protein, partial [Candidatus Hydrogenedentes bacterium]|nr:HEAT repeat domain-containing protein [Candidatus Hydrogenedentota bacterium]
MRKHSFVVLMTVLAALGAMAQSDPVAVLQSDAPLFEKNEACRLLSTSGNVDAILVLETLLADESLSDMARYALEPMPGTEADAALRRALKTTSGKLKAGVVTSLGVRRDVSAVPEIIPLLNDEDGYVKEAAARTLGRIGAPEGVSALESAIARPDLAYAFAQALADGLFFAAEDLAAEGNTSGAAKIYDAVRAVEVLPVHL